MCANKALLEPLKVPKYRIYGQNCIFLVVTTHMGHYGPNLVTLGHLMTIVGAKRPDSGLIGALFAHMMAFFEPLGGLRRSGNGSVMPTLLTRVNWTIRWCLEPNLAPYKTSRGAKSAL